MRLTLVIMVEMLNSQGQNYLDNFFKRIGLFVFGKIGQLCLIVFSFSIGNFCYCGNFLRCLFCFRWV